MNNNKPRFRSAIRLLSTLLALQLPVIAQADALDNWTTNQVSTNGFLLNQVTYKNGLYVAAGGGGDGGTILTSTDGIGWTLRADSRQTGHSPSLIWALTHGGGRFVGVGHFGGTAVSTNGIDWTYGYADSYGLSGITYGAGVYVAVGSAQGAVPGPGVFTSSNGLNWTRASISPNENREFYDVAFNGSVFVATAFAGYIYTSSNGTLWTRSASPLYGKAVAFCNNRFIISGTAGTNLLSTTGTSWNAVPTGLTNLLGKPIYASGMYLARTAKGFAMSRDGTNWTQRGLSAFSAGSFSAGIPAVATDGRHVVSVGSTNYNPFSTDAFIYRSAPLVEVKMNVGQAPELVLTGVTGSTYRVESTPSFPISGSNWQIVTNLTLSTSPQVIDGGGADGVTYYRAALLP